MGGCAEREKDQEEFRRQEFNCKEIDWQEEEEVSGECFRLVQKRDASSTTGRKTSTGRDGVEYVSEKIDSEEVPHGKGESFASLPRKEPGGRMETCDYLL